MEKERAPICMSIQDENIFYAMTCLCSVWEKTKDRFVYLICNQNIKNRQYFQDWVLQYKGYSDDIEIIFVEDNSEILLNLPEALHIYHNVLFLNAKSLLLTNIEQLYNLNLGDNIFGACKKNLSQKRLKYNMSRLGLEETAYLDFSFCLINIPKYLEYNVGGRCREKIQANRDFWTPVEDSLNVEFGTKCCVLDAAWNVPLGNIQSDQRLDWYTAETQNRIQTCSEGYACNFYENSLEEIISSAYGKLFLMYARETPAYSFFIQELFRRDEGNKGMEHYRSIILVQDEEIEKLKKEIREYQEEIDDIKHSLAYRMARKIEHMMRKFSVLKNG